MLTAMPVIMLQRHSHSILFIKECNHLQKSNIHAESSFLFTFVIFTFKSNNLLLLSWEIKNVRSRNYQNEPSHFTHEETETDGRPTNLIKVTVHSGRPRIRTQVSQRYIPGQDQEKKSILGKCTTLNWFMITQNNHDI